MMHDLLVYTAGVLTVVAAIAVTLLIGWWQSRGDT